MSDTNNQALPNHIGLILDGNRRWARSKGLPTLEGHRRGYDILKNIAEAAFDRGVSYVSAFIFSTENWDRSKEEVSYLMNLALKMVTRDLKDINKKGIKVVWLGSQKEVSKKLIEALKNAEEATKNNTKGTLALCFNYGGHREIAEAVKRMMGDGVVAAEVDESKIADYLYASDVPPIDIMVRTSGEQRISNFMLWRMAYSELMFMDKHWPDFTEQDLNNAITEYSHRQRRFGG